MNLKKLVRPKTFFKRFRVCNGNILIIDGMKYLYLKEVIVNVTVNGWKITFYFR